MNYLITVLAIFISIPQILFPMGVVALNGGEEAYFEDWSVEQAYTADYAVNLEKTPGKDYKILSLTDVQLEKWECYGERGKVQEKTIDKLIKDTAPDLIIMPGDNGYSTSAYLRIIKVMDAYGIPWAPIMGNHDGTCCISEFWCALKLSQAEHCLFKFGPKDMGYGNYVINITENGKIIHTLYMMDTHCVSSDTEYGIINGESSYDNLWQSQIEWYRWAVNGTTALAGKTVESTVVIHIPLAEYKTAYEAAYDTENHCYRDGYADSSWGENEEGVCCPDKNNGFFEACKELGSTKNIICGHDHINNASVVWQGIRLTYALKCGPGGYWKEYKNGGTLLTVNGAGELSLENIYVPWEAVGQGVDRSLSEKWEH